jgi:putative resolvase
MKLKQYTELIGCTYKTAWNHFKAGNIKGAYKLPTGTVVVPDNILEILRGEYERKPEPL